MPVGRGVPPSPRNTPATRELSRPRKVLEPQPTHREPEAAVAQVGVEGFAGDAGLHHHREVFRIQLQDSVHVGQVDTDAALAEGVQAVTDLHLSPGPQLEADLPAARPEPRDGR